MPRRPGRVAPTQRQAKTALANTNAELTRSQAAVQARYDLAVDAIRTFHTGVSEDFLLKQEQFKEVRDRLLKSASDFYGKLGALLGKESDLASRRALWQANYEVAELTGKVGKPEDALAAHRQVLAAREALAAETPADPEIKADVGRSLTAVASLLETTGRTKEAEVTYRKAETLLVELAPTIAEAAAARAVLANCRSRLGWLLHTTGRNDEALSVFRLARADQEALAAAPGATAESRRDLAATINRVAILLAATGKSSEAEAEYRKALAIQQKLADDNPAVTEFRSSLAMSHNNLGCLLARRASHWKRRPSTARRWRSNRSWPTTTPPSPSSAAACRSHNGSASCWRIRASYRSGGRVPQGTGDPTEAGRRQPPVTQFRNAASATTTSAGYFSGQVIGSGGRVPQGAGAATEAGRRQPHHPPISEAIWQTACVAHRLAARAGRKNGRGDRLLHAGRGDPAEARRGQLGNPRRQGYPGELPDQHGGLAPSVGEA